MPAILKCGCFAMSAVILFQCCMPANIARSVNQFEVSNDSALISSRHEVLLNDIPIKAVRELMNMFPAATAINWERTVAMGWEVFFMIDAIKMRIDFNSNGSWSQIWSRYAQPPAYINTMIDRNFTGYRIKSLSGVTFYWDRNNTMLSILITKAGNCKIIKLYKGDMSVFADFDDNLSTE